MRTIFTAEMSELADDLEAMAKHVKVAIDRANEALLTRNVELAQAVIAEDAELDRLEATVDERCVMLIAQQQPVSTDLRTIITSLRMSASLERMGDLAQHIAEVARRSYPESAVPEHFTQKFTDLAQAASEAAGALIDLVKTRDLNTAAEIVEDDDNLDRLHREIYGELTSDGYDGSHQETLNVALMARYYERFGDHAVSVSRRVVYLVTGDHSDDGGKI